MIVGPDTVATPKVLSALPAAGGDQRLAAIVVGVSVALFAALVPFATLKLPRVDAFIPMYQSALLIVDVVTAALLFAQHRVGGSRGLFVLACGYLYTAAITAAHTLAFPALFTPDGLLGAGPQTTAWLYMAWHAAFPMFVIGYALSRDAPLSASGRAGTIAGVVLLVAATIALATAGAGWLPPIMHGNGYASAYGVTAGAVWASSVLALFVLWRRRRRTVLDVWLIVTMIVWLCEVGLAAVLNAGRFDLGFYAGRVYGLCAATLVLIVLLSEYTVLYGRVSEAALERAARQERDKVAEERRRLLERERAARADAEAANRSKDEFLAMLGHELRNPLAPIRTALELMRLRGDGALLQERRIVERQVEHLVRLVDDLMDVSRITRGLIRIRREPVDVSAIVASAVEMSSPLIERHGHALAIDLAAGLNVIGDHGRLAQVLSNLLTNAAKFTPRHGRIDVVGRRERGEVVLRVRDTGVGLQPDAAESIFEPFVQQRQASDRSHGGLGLGLAIVRSLVELHGGTVRARSDGPGRGAEFEVRLPAALGKTPAEPPDDRTLPVPLPAEVRTVLIVDDNGDAAESLAALLRMAGHTVQVARDGPQALRVVEDFAPDVALLDLGLPVMDGFELARHLRRLPALNRTRLVALTGYGESSDRQRSAAAGFAEHLVKPVDLDTVLAIVRVGPSSPGA